MPVHFVVRMYIWMFYRPGSYIRKKIFTFERYMSNDKWRWSSKTFKNHQFILLYINRSRIHVVSFEIGTAKL